MKLFSHIDYQVVIVEARCLQGQQLVLIPYAGTIRYITALYVHPLSGAISGVEANPQTDIRSPGIKCCLLRRIHQHTANTLVLKSHQHIKIAKVWNTHL